MMRTLAKFTNHLKPFSVTLEPFLNDIETSQQKVRGFADMAIMERIKGANQRNQLLLVRFIES
jgi:hypothetical protein